MIDLWRWTWNCQTCGKALPFPGPLEARTCRGYIHWLVLRYGPPDPARAEWLSQIRPDWYERQCRYPPPSPTTLRYLTRLRNDCRRKVAPKLPWPPWLPDPLPSLNLWGYLGTLMIEAREVLADWYEEHDQGEVATLIRTMTDSDLLTIPPI